MILRTRRLARGALPAAALTTILTACLLWPAHARAGEFGTAYAGQGRCGPFARAQVSTPPRTCVGIVAGRPHLTPAEQADFDRLKLKASGKKATDLKPKAAKASD